MKDKGNIEELFKNTFEHFEADVNPSIWTNVQSGISASASGPASAFAKLAVGKLAAGVVVVAAVAASIWYVASENSPKTSPAISNNHQTPSTTVPTETVQHLSSGSGPANALSNSHANKQTASTNPSADKNMAIVPDQEILTSAGSENTDATENSLSENQSAAQPAHKYGNATQGDGGLIRWNKPGNYSGSNPIGSTDTQEDEASSSMANIFVSISSGDAPLTVEFMNQGGSSSLSWDFGDGSGSKENSPTHTFDKAGTYVVTLVSKNSSGTTSDKVTIEVKPVSEITLTNIFTPNGDGDNDLFHPITKNIASIGVVIFNQKNGIVCDWNSADGSWNGKLKNGEDAPEGIYFYTIQAIGTDGVPHSEKGTVTLNRH